MKKTLIYTAVLLALPGAVFAQSPATSTSKVEDVVFKKNTTPAVSVGAAAALSETSVRLGDSVTVNLTSQQDPATPIDLFVLAFEANGFPTKRIFIKTVFNEEKGVLKKYRININQDLLSELQNAHHMRIGHCLGGCLKNTARLVPGRILLPRTIAAPATSTTQLNTLQTF